jgi:hypothetical protein
MCAFCGASVWRLEAKRERKVMKIGFALALVAQLPHCSAATKLQLTSVREIMRHSSIDQQT